MNTPGQIPAPHLDEIARRLKRREALLACRKIGMAQQSIMSSAVSAGVIEIGEYEVITARLSVTNDDLLTRAEVGY